MRVLVSLVQPKIVICQLGCHCDEYTYKYSAALIEKSEGHVMEYFAKRDRRSDELRQEVMSYPEYLRYVCIKCRREYGLQLVLDEAPPIVTSVETIDDLFHGEWSYQHTTGGGNITHFSPLFYSGGAFDSAYVRWKEYEVDQPVVGRHESTADY